MLQTELAGITECHCLLGSQEKLFIMAHDGECEIMSDQSLKPTLILVVRETEGTLGKEFSWRWKARYFWFCNFEDCLKQHQSITENLATN